MLRFYLLILASFVALFAASRAGAQTPPRPVSGQPALGTSMTAAEMRDLPLSNNPQTALETIQLETISSRISTGGLNLTPAPRVGGLLNSWTQTQFRIGDIAITDPRAGGTPLLLPLFPFFERAAIAVASMSADDNAPGVSMTLDPARPGKEWRRVIEGSLSGSGLTATATGGVPAVDRVRQWQEGNALVSGPLNARAGIAAGGSWRGLLHVAAPDTDAVNDQSASAFVHIVANAGARDEVRALGWIQHIATPGVTDDAVHAQSTWEHRAAPAAWGWRAFGGYTGRSRSTPPTPSITIDSILSDPIAELLDSGTGEARRWTLGARVHADPAGNGPAFGFDLDGAQVRSATTINQIRELVEGVPARVWSVRASGAASRHSTTISAFGSEHWTADRLTVDAGLRLDSVRAMADAATAGIQWTTWLPQADARLEVEPKTHLEAVASYRRSAYQLPLNVLAIGDPAAPIADVARMTSPTGPLVLIARVGPGTGGDATFTQIDAALRRPVTDELVLALEWRPRPALHVEFARVTKREDSLLSFVNTGVPPESYTPVQVADPSFIPSSPVGAAQVTAYNRPSFSDGRDRYLLTNRTGEPARSWALELKVRAETERLALLVGGALTEADGPAADVGFLPTQNDQDVLGNLFVDRNQDTAARGQLFQDRSHVVKMAGIYRFPRRVTAGAILRYQDGQPFSRIVIASLAQGATAVRSYANGGSAFTYTATLDVRLQKAFTLGGAEVSAIADVYNITNLDNEVTEYIVTGPKFRTPTALQPPRTALVGLRVSF